MKILEWFKNLNKQEEVKICAKCKWYRINGTRRDCDNPEYSEIDIVTGKFRDHPSCCEMRTTAWRCGYTGKGFLPIDKEGEKYNIQTSNQRKGLSMKCERSRKRNLLKLWGMKALGNGQTFQEVVTTIGKMMKKPMNEIEEFVKETK